ncbi:MAG: hypothetical protein P4L71_01320 [Acetobacteraceae bacterium]|nr:hypothetical protein [Acetobacteraceae bacterium]
MEEPSPKGLAFCAELAVHGGVAVSEQGFKAEAELLQMRQAGLLDLQRDEAPPFAVTRVALSHKARELLAEPDRTTTDGSRTDVAGNVPKTAVAKQEQVLRRNGFEVARGMITAAVKSEIAAWNAEGEPEGYAGLEARILARIARIEVPFLP